MASDEKKTICMIGAFPPPVHGQAVAFETLAESPDVLKRYHVIKVDYAPKKQFNKYIMIPYKLLCNFNMIHRLKKVVRDNKVDLFYLGMSSSDQGATRDYLIAKTIEKSLSNAKLIIHHHGGNFRTFYEKTDDKHRSMVNYYLNKTDCAIVLTPKLKKLFESLISEDKIKVVSNGISAANKIAEDTIEQKIIGLKQNDTIHVLYLSNMIRTKGYYELLQSAPILLEAGIHFDITFAGAFRSTSDETQFHEFIKRYNLEKSVKYAGLVTGSAKNKLLETSNIFVLPTSYPNEGQPISILEAMAAGIAIITTDHGGISDVIKDGTNGILIKSITPDEIAKAIIRFNSDRDFLTKVCVENQKVSNEQYMETHYVNRMLCIFDEYSK